jgi:tetratricopeptide (TPR) repeat protein
VGRDGVIEWIGHPARIDEPLAKVVDGTWDRAAAIAEYEVELKRMKAAAETRKVQLALSKAVIAKDWPLAMTIVDELIKLDPDSPLPQLSKLSVLSQSGQSEAASELMKTLVQADWDKGVILSSIASGIAAARFPGTLDDAERIAKRAVELSDEKGLGQMHTLARVYAEKGQLDEAIKWEKKALDVSGGNAVIKRTLEQYEKKREQEGATPESSSK